MLAHAPEGPPSKLALATRQRRAIGAPAYACEPALYRGHCFGRVVRRFGREMHQACPSRYAVVRVTVDLTSAAAQELYAQRECALCGRVWGRCAIPHQRDVQRARVTLILPATSHRYFARGRWHRQGADALIIAEATLADLIAALDDWRVRADRLAASRARAKAKRAAAEAEALERARALMAHIAAREAAEAEAEAAAAAREAAS